MTATAHLAADLHFAFGDGARYPEHTHTNEAVVDLDDGAFLNVIQEVRIIHAHQSFTLQLGIDGEIKSIAFHQHHGHG